MRNILAVGFVCVVFAALLSIFGLPVAVSAAESRTAAGHYVLQGMREVGSELVLREDGRFQYMLAFFRYRAST